MSAPELKPCPFCGKNGKLMHGGPGNWFVQCQWCMASTDDGSIDRAIERWNRRADLPPTKSEALRCPEVQALVWHRVEDKLPEVAQVVLVASPRKDHWQVRSARLYIRHEGVRPTPEQIADRPTDFWFDSAYPGTGDMRLVRPGVMWAEMPAPPCTALAAFPKDRTP
jgi:hypothetical protein